MREKYGEHGRNPYDGLRFYSALTHGIGAGLSLIALAALCLRGLALSAPPIQILSVILYTISMFGLYTASTLYHSLNTGVSGRLFLRKLDHVMIYFLISGTYTPVCLLALGGMVTARILLIAVWSLAILGTALTLFWINMPRFLTSMIYLFMGWTAIFAIIPLHAAMTAMEFATLLAGGVLYSIGGILYALKWPGRDCPRFGCHEIFHVFILLGSICHFLTVWLLLG